MSTYLVDGSNVAHSAVWRGLVEREQGELPHDLRGMGRVDARARLVDWVLAWRTHSGADVVLVFDGAGPQGAGSRHVDHGYVVIGSGGDDGDDVIEAQAARLVETGVTFRLVTDDRALANVAGARAEAVLSVAGFVNDLVATLEPKVGATGSNVELEAFDVSHGEPQPTRLADDLDDDVRTKLERMRRGLDR